ncbi:phosphate ABC transporter permease subunit PstC [Streptomyces sp. NPDC041068]|uniref:phosphate ABC transporter permease subunit PstC n=1 Tax=Streptomyces sp. NPDC041068 TaxID=3155130 RepID=UPI0033D2A943
MPARKREAVPDAGGSPRLGRSRPRHGERVIRIGLIAAALVSIATTIGIVVSLIEPSVRFFGEVSAKEFFTGTQWTPLFEPARYGVLPLVAATLLITVIALLVALPLGLASAIYLSEYATPRTRGVLKPALELLAGIPTVVFGFFALKFLTPRLQGIWPWGEGPDIFNALSAGLVMGMMIIPTIASLSEDALSAVPHSLRDGAYAMGASKRVVATTVVVPAALSGIVAAFVLGVSRAVGETMIVAIASGNRPNLTWNPLEAMQTMTGFIAQAASGDVPVGTVDYHTLFAVGLLLFTLTFAMNAVSIRLVRRFREVYE